MDLSSSEIFDIDQVPFLARLAQKPSKLVLQRKRTWWPMTGTDISKLDEGTSNVSAKLRKRLPSHDDCIMCTLEFLMLDTCKLMALVWSHHVLVLGANRNLSITVTVPSAKSRPFRMSRTPLLIEIKCYMYAWCDNLPCGMQDLHGRANYIPHYVIKGSIIVH